MENKSQKGVIFIFLIVIPPILAVIGYIMEVFDDSDVIHFLISFCMLCAMFLIHRDTEDNKRKSDKILHNLLKEYQFTGRSDDASHPIPEKERGSKDKDVLKITKSKKPGDSYIVLGAVRVPYLSFNLSAGSKDVCVEKICVRPIGQVSNFNFKGISLVDTDGVQISHIDTSGRYMSDVESFETKFIIPKNRSITLVVAADANDDESTFISGICAGFEVVDIITDTKKEGDLPIQGSAVHVFSAGILLQKTKVLFRKNKLSIKISPNKESDKEGAYIRHLMLKFEHGVSDQEDIKIIARGVDYPLEIDGDMCLAEFPHDGLYIKSGEKIRMSIFSAKNKKLNIREISYVYILGAEYGYGLPTDIKKSPFLF